MIVLYSILLFYVCVLFFFIERKWTRAIFHNNNRNDLALNVKSLCSLFLFIIIVILFLRSKIFALILNLTNITSWTFFFLHLFIYLSFLHWTKNKIGTCVFLNTQAVNCLSFHFFNYCLRTQRSDKN